MEKNLKNKWKIDKKKSINLSAQFEFKEFLINMLY